MPKIAVKQNLQQQLRYLEAAPKQPHLNYICLANKKHLIQTKKFIG